MTRFRSILEVTKQEWLDGLGLGADEIPDCVILEGSWWRAERQALRLGYLRNVRELGFPDIFWGEWGDKKIVFCMAYGAPRAVEISQMFSFLGCKLVVQIGTCGGLQSILSPGDIILPQEIVCEDGVAVHYAKDGAVKATPKWIERAHALMVARGRKVHVGPHVTFSSLFAETTEMYETWQAAGYLSVEMETATTIAAAAYYGVDAVSLVVVWDDLSRGRRFLDPMEPAALAELDRSNKDVFEVALALAEQT